MKGKHIVVEGVHGSGKTTLIQLIEKELLFKSVPVFTVKEPSEGPIGKQIRRMLTENIKVNDECYLALFNADREHQYNNVVAPALEAGIHVLQDRSFYSSVVYQSTLGAGSLSPDIVLSACRVVVADPDLVLVLNLSKDTLVRRIAQRQQKWDVFKDDHTLSRALHGYRDLRDYNPDIKLLNAEYAPSVICEEALTHVWSVLNRHW